MTECELSWGECGHYTPHHCDGDEGHPDNHHCGYCPAMVGRGDELSVSSPKGEQ